MWENETSRWQGWPRDYSLPSSLVSVPCFNFILMDLYLTKDVFTHHLFFQTNLIRPWRGLLSKYKQQFLFKFPINCLISLFDKFVWSSGKLLDIAWGLVFVKLYTGFAYCSLYKGRAILKLAATGVHHTSKAVMKVLWRSYWYQFIKCMILFGFIFLSIKWCK